MIKEGFKKAPSSILSKTICKSGSWHIKGEEIFKEVYETSVTSKMSQYLIDVTIITDTILV